MFYVTEISDDTGVVAYKLGITNQSASARRKQTQAKTSLVLTEFFEWHGNGAVVLELESRLKTMYKLRYIENVVMVDGHTETFSPDLLSEIMLEIETFVGANS